METNLSFSGSFSSCYGASLASSETIEIDDEKLVIRRKNLGWTRTAEYEISKCTDLRANEKQNWIFSTALWCKVGGRVINFGQDMSYDQVAQLIVELKAKPAARCGPTFDAHGLHDPQFELSTKRVTGFRPLVKAHG